MRFSSFCPRLPAVASLTSESEQPQGQRGLWKHRAVYCGAENARVKFPDSAKVTITRFAYLLAYAELSAQSDAYLSAFNV